MKCPGCRSATPSYWWFLCCKQYFLIKTKNYWCWLVWTALKLWRLGLVWVENTACVSLSVLLAVSAGNMLEAQIFETFVWSQQNFYCSENTVPNFKSHCLFNFLFVFTAWRWCKFSVIQVRMGNILPLTQSCKKIIFNWLFFGPLW